MNEPIKPTAAFKFNKDQALAKIKEVRNHLQTFVARPGYNPYVWMKANLEPLETRLNDGEESYELQTAIANLKLVEPVAKGAEHNVLNPPKEHAAAGKPMSEAAQNKMAEQVKHQVSPKIGQ